MVAAGAPGFHLGLQPRLDHRHGPHHDHTDVNPERVRDLYADIGSPQKAFVDLGCSAHAAMWEKNHLALFAASLEWLDKGTVQGQSNVMVKLGY